MVARSAAPWAAANVAESVEEARPGMRAALAVARWAVAAEKAVMTASGGEGLRAAPWEATGGGQILLARAETPRRA